MQLREALSDIAEIRAALDRSPTYRGFRSIAIGISAIFVLAGAVYQLQFDVSRLPTKYLNIWLGVALASLSVTVIEMILRGRISNDMSVWKMHGRVAGALAPSFIVGAFVTAGLVLETKQSLLSLSRDNIWLLPGVWALVYSLGLFACYSLLHRSTWYAASYFLVCGCLYIVINWSEREIQAWHMVAIFGVGQLMLAGLLYWNVERARG